MNTIKYTIPFVVLLLLVGQVGVEAAPLGTGFTYQGQLKLDGRPAHDTCDLTFSLWEAAVGPPQVGSTQVRNNFNVSNGLITTKLDFGNVFDGSTRWLEVRVRCPAGFGVYATLSPRQELTAGPYALFATKGPGGGGDGHSLDAADGDPVDAVFVDNNGNVGIRTTNPQRTLQVGDETVLGSEGMIRLESRSSTGSGHLRGWDIGVPETAEDLSGVGYSFVIDDTRRGTDPEFMVKWGTGNVGIGTVAPASRLDVAGEARMEGARFPGGFGPDNAYVGTPGNYLSFGHAGVSEDFIGYKSNTFYFMDSPGGGDTLDPDVVVGGNVGIGTTNPATRLHVEHSVADEETIRAVHTAVSDDTPAVLGQHNVTGYYGIGVKGVAGWIGVQGEVQGSGSDDYYGVEGTAESADGYNYGVTAYASGTTGDNWGVSAIGRSASGDSYGVEGRAHSDTGDSYGLYGHAGSDTRSIGVYGTAHTTTGGTAYGVYGTTSGTNGTLWAGYFDGRGYFEGDVGIGTDAPDGRLDVRGGDLIMDSWGAKLRLRLDSTGDGWGFATAGGGAHLWLQEIPAGGATSTRVSFQSGGNVGIGTTSPGAKLDVRGSVRVRSNSGVRVDNSTGSERAVMFVESAGKGALWLRGPNGNLNVTLRGQNGNHNVGTIVVYDSAGADQASMWVDPGTGLGHLSADVKSFKVANPRDPATDIWYVSLEGPEAGAYYRGTATLTDGTAVVVFPAHFQDVVSTTQMTVQLTPRSAASWGLACTHVDGQGLVVQELNEGKGNYEFDYVVTDVRKGLENWEVIKQKSEFGPQLGEPIPEATGSAATAADPTDVETELADGFAETNPPTIRDDPSSVDQRDSIRPIREIIQERDAELAGQRSQIADLMARLERLERRLPKVDSEKRGR